MRSREERLQQLRRDDGCDVLIVGAGINGIGAYHDLVLQGLKVVLVDRADYCSGASAASSHMVHGGLRYLENGEFRLVAEAVRERNRLLQNAPHLVRPLPTTVPIFRHFSGLLNAPLKFLGLRGRPAERGALVIKLGLLLYDWFARTQRVVQRHMFRARRDSLRAFPDLNPRVLYTATYYDAAMPSPERLAMEVLLDAREADADSVALNYVSLQSAEGEFVILKDELSGELVRLRPKVLVNAAGPWIDLVNQSVGLSSDYIGGTKGSHLVVEHPELRAAIGEHEIFFENEDGRIVLLFPLQDRVLIGTSDIRFQHPDEAVITEDEIDYFFAMIKRVFPGIALHRNQIVFTFSGVRPLPQEASDRTGQISRDHKIELIESSARHPYPIYSLVGGKWTTFRAFAEAVSGRVLARLGRERRISTKELRIGGGRGYPMNDEGRAQLTAAWHTEYGCPPERAEQLLERYGTRGADMLAAFHASDDRPLNAYPDYGRAEIEYLARHEDVAHLDDLIFRRSLLGMLGRITEEGLLELAQVSAEALGWSPDQVREEIERVQRILRDKHGMSFNRYLSLAKSREEEVV